MYECVPVHGYILGSRNKVAKGVLMIELEMYEAVKGLRLEG